MYTQTERHESSWEWLQDFYKMNCLKTERTSCYWGLINYIKNNHVIINYINEWNKLLPLAMWNYFQGTLGIFLNADKWFEHDMFCAFWTSSVVLLTYSQTRGKDWKPRSLQCGPEHCWLHRSHHTLWMHILSCCWALIFAMVRVCTLLALSVHFLFTLSFLWCWG